MTTRYNKSPHLLMPTAGGWPSAGPSVRLSCMLKTPMGLADLAKHRTFAECFFWHSSMDMDTQNVEDTCCVDIIDIQIIGCGSLYVNIFVMTCILKQPLASGRFIPVL